MVVLFPGTDDDGNDESAEFEFQDDEANNSKRPTTKKKRNIETKKNEKIKSKPKGKNFSLCFSKFL